MLTNSAALLKAAQAGSYAVGAFNTSNLIFSQAIVEAAAELEAPVIVETSEKAIEFATLDALYSMVKALADNVSIPVVLHLDHGRHPELIRQALRLGYPSVMFDGSNLTFADNLRLTKELSAEAHHYGASIEAEVGHVAGREDYVESHDILLTDPDQAAQFAEETQVDALAIAFGNAHGKPTAKEVLNFDLVKTIRQRVQTPLVFHGASSTPDADMRRAIKAGMTKVNIDTDLRMAATLAIRHFLADNPDTIDPRDYFGAAREAVKAVVQAKINLFGSAGKAQNV